MNEQQRHDLDRRQGKVDKGRWLSRLKSWFATSEPSTQALKQHRRMVYKSSGVTSKDPQASAKLHVPAATIPDNAIKPASGPDPDDMARRRALEKRLKQLPRSEFSPSSGPHSARSQSMSSSVVSSGQGAGPRPPYFPV